MKNIPIIRNIHSYHCSLYHRQIASYKILVGNFPKNTDKRDIHLASLILANEGERNTLNDLPFMIQSNIYFNSGYKVITKADQPDDGIHLIDENTNTVIKITLYGNTGYILINGNFIEDEDDEEEESVVIPRSPAKILEFKRTKNFSTHH